MPGRWPCPHSQHPSAIRAILAKPTHFGSFPLFYSPLQGRSSIALLSWWTWCSQKHPKIPLLHIDGAICATQTLQQAALQERQAAQAASQPCTAPTVALWVCFSTPQFHPRGWVRLKGGFFFASGFCCCFVVLMHVLPWWHCALLTPGAAEAGCRRVGSREEQNKIFQLYDSPPLAPPPPHPC